MDQDLAAKLLSPALDALRHGELTAEQVRAFAHAAEVLVRVTGFLIARSDCLVPPINKNSAPAEDAELLVEIVLKRDTGVLVPPVEDV